MDCKKINRNLIKVNNISESSASGARKTSETSENLQKPAGQLQHQISQFKVD